MKQIGVVGKPSRKRFQVVNKLEGQQSYRVQIFSGTNELQFAMQTESISGLVFVEDEFSDQHMEMMDSISNQYADLVVLCLVSKVNQSQRDEFRRYNIPRSTVLDINHELKDLRGIVDKMVRGDQVALRTHYRYAVSKRAQLIRRTGPASRIQIVDISAGGLQAKGMQGPAQIGEIVQIKVPKDNGAGSHMIIGRIAWANKRGAFGVQFDQVMDSSKPRPMNQTA